MSYLMGGVKVEGKEEVGAPRLSSRRKEAASRRSRSPARREAADSVKVATLQIGPQNERLLEHIQLNPSAFSNYAELRVMVASYFQARLTWQPDATEVDALATRGGKDRGRGRGAGPSTASTTPGGKPWAGVVAGKAGPLGPRMRPRNPQF